MMTTMRLGTTPATMVRGASVFLKAKSGTSTPIVVDFVQTPFRVDINTQNTGGLHPRFSLRHGRRHFVVGSAREVSSQGQCDDPHKPLPWDCDCRFSICVSMKNECARNFQAHLP